jgi:hypothetical protein
MRRTGAPSPAISGLAFNVIPKAHRSHPAVQAAARALDDGRAGIEDQREREGPIAADSTETEALKAVLKAELSDKTVARIFPRIDAAHAGLVRAERGVELATKQIFSSRAKRFDEEVRTRLFGMSEDAREARAAEAERTGNIEVLGPILDADPMLSGFKRERWELLRESYLLRHHPDLVGQREALRQAREILQRGGGAVMKVWAEIQEDARQARQERQARINAMES